MIPTLRPRWLFLLLGLSWLGALPGPAQKIRIVAANITSGNRQNYDGGHGIRILKGLDPDIILIQEFNYLSNNEEDTRAFTDEVMEGPGFHFFREPGGENIPNGVISRYPILEAGQWDQPVGDRDHAWARIDLPGNRELLVVSVHLRTDDGLRPGEAAQLVDYINAYYAAGGARATDYLVIGGDFNSDSRTEAALNTLGSLVTIASPWPVDRDGNANTNAGRTSPYDAVYAGKGLHALRTPTVIGASIFPSGLVADTRAYSPISEIAPALATDSFVPLSSSNQTNSMQHQAVVRDFQLPIPADPAVLEILSSNIRTSNPAHVQLTFRSTTGAPYDVQATSSLTAASWTTLGSLTATSGTTAVTIVTTVPGAGQVRDPLLATTPRRFYRVIRR